MRQSRRLKRLTSLHHDPGACSSLHVPLCDTVAASLDSKRKLKCYLITNGDVRTEQLCLTARTHQVAILTVYGSSEHTLTGHPTLLPTGSALSQSAAGGGTAVLVDQLCK